MGTFHFLSIFYTGGAYMKEQYKKPQIFVIDGLTEGVYAASGSNGSASVSYSLTQTDQWEDGKGYNMVCTNTGTEPLFTFTINLTLIGDVTYLFSCNRDPAIASISMNGSTAAITIRVDDQTNGLAPNASTRTIHLDAFGIGQNFNLS
jgi:hypothetical protein